MGTGLKGSGKDTNGKDLALALKVREALKTSLGPVFVQLQVPGFPEPGDLHLWLVLGRLTGLHSFT